MTKHAPSEVSEISKNSSSIKLTSEDSSNNEYMINDDRIIFNFDHVEKDYSKRLGLPNLESVDGLIEDIDQHWELIEFKNGRIGKKTSFEIRRKIYNSLLMLCDLTESTISDTRANCDFCLVYNESKNGEIGVWEGIENPDTHVPMGPAKLYLVKRLLQKAGERFIRFNLSRFQGFCFRAVYTFTEQEFEAHLKTVNPVQVR